MPFVFVLVWVCVERKRSRESKRDIKKEKKREYNGQTTIRMNIISMTLRAEISLIPCRAVLICAAAFVFRWSRCSWDYFESV